VCVLTEKWNTFGWVQEAWSWQQDGRSSYWREWSYNVIRWEDGKKICIGATGAQHV